MKTISEKQRMIEFLKENFACKKGFEFAVRECNSLKDCWNKVKPDWLVWLSTRKGILTDRELHEFMLASAESVKHLMKDQRSLDALTVKRRWLDGEATDEELNEARRASAAVYAATHYAASAATHYAASAAAYYAVAAANAYTAAYYAAAAYYDAAYYDAYDVAYTAAYAAAAYADERTKQADWLRNNTKPQFSSTSHGLTLNKTGMFRV